MRSFLMVVVSILVILAVWTVAAVVVMSVVVDRRGVERVSIPEDTLIEGALDGADLADAYTMKVSRGRIPDVSKLVENASMKGDSTLASSANEILRTGQSPGVSYQVSYLWRPTDDEKVATVTMTTAVRYENWERRVNPVFTGPGRRILAPFILSESVKNAARR